MAAASRTSPGSPHEADLVVNTTTVGMHGTRFDDLALDLLPKSALVTDIVYTPLETPLLAAARLLGLTTVDGLGMLLHQAVPGFEAWFGVRPEVTPELRAQDRGDALMQKLGLTGSIATGKSTVLEMHSRRSASRSSRPTRRCTRSTRARPCRWSKRFSPELATTARSTARRSPQRSSAIPSG